MCCSEKRLGQEYSQAIGVGKASDCVEVLFLI